MSQAEQYYRNEVRTRFLAVLDDFNLPSEKRKFYLDAIDDMLDSGGAITIVHRDIVAFIERLLNRQGTKLPDFAPLYKKKAELDRKLFGDFP